MVRPSKEPGERRVVQMNLKWTEDEMRRLRRASERDGFQTLWEWAQRVLLDAERKGR